MKFTLSWLKDHLDTTATLDTIAVRLSAIGIEVEGIEDPAATLGAFTIARVLEATKHPNADSLRVAQVEIASGKPPVEVVCGAHNCRTGMIAVFAPLGTFVPGTGITLDKRPIRGVVSNGMLVSERELQLSDDHEGIIELPEDRAAHIGARYIDVMGLDDPVIEVKLTPNRPDCTGVRGIARDLAAAGLGKLKAEPSLGRIEGSAPCPIDIRLEFAAADAKACPMFAGRYVSGVKNGPSPPWMQRRLKAAGLRPISTLVDITNYISLDRGRPLHVYDADKLTGVLRARLAKDGESFDGLDGKHYALTTDMCVIADDAGVLGLGGILGGASSGCSDDTRNVLIECAYFDPQRTATTGRKAGVQTDARYRFERGVDPTFVEDGLDLATDMVLKLCGGSPSQRRIAGEAPEGTRTIAFDLARVKRLAGIDMKPAEIKRILEALGCEVSGKGPMVKVTTPPWRPDMHGQADLVEEVARIHGLENVASVPMPRLGDTTRAVLTDKQRRARRLRRLLASRGMVEAVTWSFISREQAELFGGGAFELEVANPISVELAIMRPSLLPGLLTALQRNRNRGFKDVSLFELGQAYAGAEPAEQLLLASGVRAGASRMEGAGRNWRDPMPASDLFDAKADVAAALSAAGFDISRAQVTRDVPGWYHPGRSGALKLGPKTVLAHFGEVHPAILKALDVEGPVAAFEVFLDAIPAEKKKATKARPPLPALDLLPLKRDFAFTLDADVSAGDVVKAALAADKALVTDVSVFDVYAGDKVAVGKKSLAIEVTIQPRDKTLTDADIEALSQRVVNEVKKATGGEIRG